MIETVSLFQFLCFYLFGLHEVPLQIILSMIIGALTLALSPYLGGVVVFDKEIPKLPIIVNKWLRKIGVFIVLLSILINIRWIELLTK